MAGLWIYFEGRPTVFIDELDMEISENETSQ